MTNKSIKFKITNTLKISLVLVLFSGALNSFAQSDIVITEIMYNQPGNDSLEFIELYNKGGVSIDLNGYTFAEGIDYTFPSYILNPGSYVVVAKYQAYINSFFGISSLQWTAGDLSNSGEKIVLKSSTDVIIDSVEYDDDNPWDPNADGSGSSLILCDPNVNNALGYFWVACNQFKGFFLGSIIFANAGTGNAACTPPGEIFPPNVKKASVYSPTVIKIKFDEPVSLSSSQNVVNYTGLGTISSATRSASLDSVTLVLFTPLPAGFVDSLYINNISDTSGNAMTDAEIKLIAFNNTISNLVITEIMYDNPGNDTLEYIEVYNNDVTAAQVGGYEFTDGCSFIFPSMMTINPGEYVVIAANPNFTNAFFGISTSLQFTGNLINTGEKLTIKNTTGDVIDSVRYSNLWHWKTNPGASLVLCDPTSDNDIGANWGASGTYVNSYLGYGVYGSPGVVNTDCSILGILGSDYYKQNINVYPNPSSGEFEIFSEQINNVRKIEIINSLGKIIHTQISESKYSKVSLSPLIYKGLYFVRVTDLESEITYIGKIVLE